MDANVTPLRIGVGITIHLNKEATLLETEGHVRQLAKKCQIISKYRIALQTKNLLSFIADCRPRFDRKTLG